MSTSSLHLEEYLEQETSSRPVGSTELETLLEEGGFRAKKLGLRYRPVREAIMYRVDNTDVYTLLARFPVYKGKKRNMDSYRVFEGDLDREFIKSDEVRDFLEPGREEF